MLPKPLLTRDQVLMLKSDNVVSEAAVREGRTLEGLVPDSALRPTLSKRSCRPISTASARPGSSTARRRPEASGPASAGSAAQERSMSEADVVIVGAGPAGLAAALSLAESGLTVAHVEARQRIGGRTSTLNIGRHGGVDVGAHWMHAPRINPLAKAARRLGVDLLSADAGPSSSTGTKSSGPGAR